MSYTLDYGSVIQIPTENEYGLITKELKNFIDGDFTVILRVKSSSDNILKNKKLDENQESCVFGRAGMHFGLFYVPSINSYKFTYWDSEDGVTFNYNDIHGMSLDTEDFVTLCLSHSKKEKSFNFFIDGEHVGEKIYKNILDYSNTFIFLGVANLLDNAYPHQCFWAGEVDFLEMYDEKIDSKILQSISSLTSLSKIDKISSSYSKSLSYDFKDEKMTYYSIFDDSNNGNRGRINQQKINKEYNLV